MTRNKGWHRPVTQLMRAPTLIDLSSPASSLPAEPELSLLRLYLLRVCYLILTLGLGVYMWPSVFRHSSDFAIRAGIQMSLLAGLGLVAALGLRYPLKMLPLLIFELTWKAIYLLGFALPLWLAHGVNEKAAADIGSCLMVFLFIPLIPWTYVFARFAANKGDPWR